MGALRLLGSCGSDGHVGELDATLKQCLVDLPEVRERLLFPLKLLAPFLNKGCNTVLNLDDEICLVMHIKWRIFNLPPGAFSGC